MSEAHAVLEAQCAACHVQTAGTFSAKAGDAACLSCHDGPIHHASQIGAASCVTCHAEHRGRVNLVAASNASCATCHGDLSKSSSATHFQSSIYSFEKGHPEFAAVRGDPRDPGTIRVNHAIHMKPIRRGPNGPNVQLECGDCHQAAAATVRWPYADTKYTSAKTSYSMQDELLAGSPAGLPRATPASGRELMAPVKFANGCEGCHLLTFDKRFDEGVPHDTPEVVHAFLLKKFGEYIAAHPTETREVREPGRDLSGKPLAAAVRMLTPAQWVMERTAEAEDLLSRKTCKQCHTLSAGEGLPRSLQPRPLCSGCRTRDSITTRIEDSRAQVATKRRSPARSPATCCCRGSRLAKHATRQVRSMLSRGASSATRITTGRSERD